MKEKFKGMGFLKLGRQMVDHLNKENYEVKSDFNGGEQPQKYREFIPDIFAKKGDEILYIEVVTKEYLRDPDNLKRVEKFSMNIASEQSTSIKFMLMSPIEDLEEIKRIVKEKNIYVNKFYFNEN